MSKGYEQIKQDTPMQAIDGNIYMWMGRDASEVSPKSNKKQFYAILIVLLQVLAPPAIVYYFASSANWTTLWKFQPNIFGTIDYSLTAPGNNLPLWPNIITKKVVAALTFNLFAHSLQKSITTKEKNLQKIKLDQEILSKGNKIFLKMAGPIMASTNLCTALATWMVLMVQPDVMNVFAEVTGLALLATLDEMGGIDLSPLTVDDWDGDAAATQYFEKVMGEYPQADPTNDALMKPYLEPHRSWCMNIASTVLDIISIVAPFTFFFVNQAEIEIFEGGLA